MSPRPRKPRHCRCPLRATGELVFKPAGQPAHRPTSVSLARDEFEALVLCDRDGLTQEQAGASMGVSRGTVQRLLSAARRKVAVALAAGQALVLHAGTPPDSAGREAGP